MSISGRIEKPFTVRFIDAGAKVLLELTNTSDESFKGVEILAVFLKDEETPGGGRQTVSEMGIQVGILVSPKQALPFQRGQSNHPDF